MNVTGKQVVGGLVLLVMLAVFGIASEMNYTDQQREQAVYCAMVKNQLWPDYKHSYRDECRRQLARDMVQ